MRSRHRPSQPPARNRNPGRRRPARSRNRRPARSRRPVRCRPPCPSSPCPDDHRLGRDSWDPRPSIGEPPGVPASGWVRLRPSRTRMPGGRGWSGEKLALHELGVHPDSVARFSPPCEGGGSQGGVFVKTSSLSLGRAQREGFSSKLAPSPSGEGWGEGRDAATPLRKSNGSPRGTMASARAIAPPGTRWFEKARGGDHPSPQPSPQGEGASINPARK